MSKDTLGAYCPRCGKDVSKDIIRCSNCGTPLSSNASRSGMLHASGVLSIIAAGLFLIGGIITLFIFFLMLPQQTFGPQPVSYLLSPQLWGLAILGGLNLVSFALSLTGGVLSLDRRQEMWVSRLLFFSIIGPFIPFAASFTTPTSYIGGNLLASYFIFFSLPAICLDAVSLIFVRLRRDDFSNS